MSIIVNGTTLTDLKVGNTDITKVYARNGETGTYVIVFEKRRSCNNGIVVRRQLENEQN